jgi:nitrite reductase/ring-hydroxylating ferredoxin subunit
MDARFPFPPYPTGWFAVGFSDEFPTDQVVTRQSFGQELVLWRTGDGVVHASDAHCPHVGAHLGFGGKVARGCITCPFHGWTFDGSGECVAIPGANRIPPRARLRTREIREQNGVLFLWHALDGSAPTWEVPVLPDDEWTRNRVVKWTLRTHPQEVFENVVDVAHIPPVHGAERSSIVRDAKGDGPRFDIEINLHADGAIVGMPGMMNDVILDVTMHGLGQAVVQTLVRNANVRARQRIYCTPVDEQRTEIRAVVNLQKLADPFMTEQVAELFYQAYVTDFAMDFPIWENKRYHERPLLSSADGPFMLYRRWATQFYERAQAERVGVA